MTGAALVFGLLAGFVLGQALMAWARSEPTPATAATEVPASLLERYHTTAHALAERAYLAGVRAGVGGRLPPESLPLHRENGQRAIAASASQVARVTAHAFTDGALTLRATLGQRTVLEAYALDKAVAHTLEEVQS